MRKLNIRSLAAAAIVAGAILAGCSGGGVKSTPPLQQQQLGKSVGVTMTFMIGSVSKQALQRNPQYIPASTQSLVIKYAGDNAAAPPTAGGANPPATAVTAATVNVAVSGSNPPPAGSCVAIGSAYQCTVTVQFPVGVLDI